MSTTYDVSPTRLAAAWTRLSDKDGSPLGRLHATHRANGSLEQEALCGFQLPARSLKARPFMIFSTSHPKACLACAISAVEEYR